MGTTLLTLVNGRTLEVRGTYEDVATLVKPRMLSGDSGHREVTLSDGERITLHTGMIGLIEQARTTTKNALGFR